MSFHLLFPCHTPAHGTSGCSDLIALRFWDALIRMPDRCAEVATLLFHTQLHSGCDWTTARRATLGLVQRVNVPLLAGGARNTESRFVGRVSFGQVGADGRRVASHELIWISPACAAPPSSLTSGVHVDFAAACHQLLIARACRRVAPPLCLHRKGTAPAGGGWSMLSRSGDLPVYVSSVARVSAVCFIVN